MWTGGQKQGLSDIQTDLIDTCSWKELPQGLEECRVASPPELPAHDHDYIVYVLGWLPPICVVSN